MEGEAEELLQLKGQDLIGVPLKVPLYQPCSACSSGDPLCCSLPCSSPLSPNHKQKSCIFVQAAGPMCQLECLLVSAGRTPVSVQ